MNTVDENGETAVHGAAHRGAPALIQYLADKGASLDRTNKIGWTPLTIAGGVYYPNLYEQYPEAEAMLKKVGARNPRRRDARSTLSRSRKARRCGSPERVKKSPVAKV